jgi:hypothetical protein
MESSEFIDGVVLASGIRRGSKRVLASELEALNRIETVRTVIFVMDIQPPGLQALLASQDASGRG